MNETKKGRKLGQQLPVVPKEVKDALSKLENDINDALKRIQGLKVNKEQLRKSADEVRSEFERGLSQLRSLIDKYIANLNVSSDAKADFKKFGGELPQLRDKLEESIKKVATEVYTKRVKVFVSNVNSTLKRLHSKIGY